MRLQLDSDLCCGHGRCYAICPELFTEDDEGHAILVAAEVPEGLAQKARSAADNCPELAITLSED